MKLIFPFVALIIAGCASTRQDHQEMAIVGELNGQPVDLTIVGETKGSTKTGPDEELIAAAAKKAAAAAIEGVKSQIPGLDAIGALIKTEVGNVGDHLARGGSGDSAGVVGGLSGWVEGLGLAGGLASATGAGVLALRNSAIGRTLKQVVRGIDAAKANLPDEHTETLKEELAKSLDESGKTLVRKLRGT